MNFLKKLFGFGNKDCDCSKDVNCCKQEEAPVVAEPAQEEAPKEEANNPQA